MWQNEIAGVALISIGFVNLYWALHVHAIARTDEPRDVKTFRRLFAGDLVFTNTLVFWLLGVQIFRDNETIELWALVVCLYIAIWPVAAFYAWTRVKDKAVA